MLIDPKRVALAFGLGAGLYAVALPDPATVWSPWVTRLSLSLFAWLALWLLPSVALSFWLRLFSPDATPGRNLGRFGISFSIAVYPFLHVLIWGFSAFGVTVARPTIPAEAFLPVVALLGLVAFAFLGIVFLEPVTYLLATEYA